MGRYAELKFIEIEMRQDPSPNKIAQCLGELKKVEEKVRLLKVPLQFADQLYGLRANINMDHEQIRNLSKKLAAEPRDAELGGSP